MKVNRQSFAKLGKGLILATALAAFSATTAAAATITIKLTDLTGGGTVTVTNGGVGNVVSYSGTVGDFFVSLESGTTYSPDGSLGLSITGNGITNTAATNQQLLVEVSGNDYTLPLGPVLLLQNTVTASVQSGLDPGAVSVSSFAEADAQNVLFDGDVATTPQTCTGLVVGGLVGACQAVPLTQSTFFTRDAGAYSLTGNATLTLNAGTTVLNYTESVAVSQVPEAGVLPMFGFALAGLTMFASRRRSLLGS